MQARRQPTAGDMLKMLAVLLVPIALILIFFTRNPADSAPVPTVDWQPVLAEARAQAPYPVLAPPATPAGWRATSASWTPAGRPDSAGHASVRNSWKLGFLTGDNVFVGLQQGDQQIPDMVASASLQGRPDGSSSVADITWQRLVSPDGRTHSLVRQTPKVTTVVTADLSYGALEAYAGSLTGP